jgi:hypothetical protein
MTDRWHPMGRGNRGCQSMTGAASTGNGKHLPPIRLPTTFQDRRGKTYVMAHVNVMRITGTARSKLSGKIRVVLGQPSGGRSWGFYIQADIQGVPLQVCYLFRWAELCKTNVTT